MESKDEERSSQLPEKKQQHLPKWIICRSGSGRGSEEDVNQQHVLTMGSVSLRLLLQHPPKINSLIHPLLSSPILLHSIPGHTQKSSYLVSTRNYSPTLLFLKKRLPLDLNTMNHVISCYSPASYQQVNYGFSMLCILFKLGFLPNQYTYHSLLTALVSQNMHLHADILFHKLITLKHIQPDFATYHSFIQGVNYLNQNSTDIQDLTRVSRSIGLLTYLKLFIGYDAIIIGYCERQQLSSVLEHFREMLFIPLTPSDNTYNSILQLLFQEGHFYQAFCFLQTMENIRVPLHSDTHAIIIHRLCQNQLFHDAVDFLTRMEVDNCSVGVHLYNVVINYLFDAGEVDKALNVFDLLSELYHIRPDATTYAEMLIGLANEGLWDEALDLLPEIESSDHLPCEFKLACHNFFNESPISAPNKSTGVDLPCTHVCKPVLPSVKQMQL